MPVKKKWIEIALPKIFGNMVIAEALTSDPKSLIGKKIEVSLPEISMEFSKFYMKLYFKIVDVNGKCRTEFVGHDCFKERIYRIVQRRRSRIDSIGNYETKDGKKIRIKAILIVGRRIRTSLKSKLRNKMSETIKKYVTKNNLDNLVNMIVNGELESLIKKECKKIYPVSTVEIYKSELLKNKVQTKKKSDEDSKQKSTS